MKFTINDLKSRGPLGHKHFKKVYDWDYVKYTNINNIEYVTAYKENGDYIRDFSFETFAYLVVMTGCEDEWYEVHTSADENLFNVSSIAEIIDVMQEYKRTLSNDAANNFEETINFCKNMLKNKGFEYYWPNIGSVFNTDYHYAIGIIADDNYNSGEIVRVCNGGIRNIITEKIYKFPKVYIAQ